jgi:hypothetical protein
VAVGELPHRNERGSALEPARTRLAQGLRFSDRFVAAILVALTAFLCYHATLLPGLDLGDSASFQTGAGSMTLTARQAYPLYHGLGAVFAWLDPNEPAHAMNLASAVYAAVAVGFATCVAAALAGSTLAGLAAGLFLAFSYTFWTQSVTAEVYTLHLLMVGASLLALLSWSERPTRRRLALFYAAYALGFGNHLSMILLLPAFAVFILIARDEKGAAVPGTFFDPIQPKAIAMAGAIAALAALQYSWNFRGMWFEPEPPANFTEALGKFWFDVTKADWRATLVMGLSEAGLRIRPLMYWFDLRQQFGFVGIGLAAAGISYLMIRRLRFGVLLVLLYLSNLMFAWTYNVGDPYIFFLPSHYIIALCAGAGVAALLQVVSGTSNQPIVTTVGVLCLIYPMWRGYDTFPAVDRSNDNRAVHLLDQMTAPINRPTTFGTKQCGEPVFGLDANWQVQNAAEYYMRERKPWVPWFTTEGFSWLEDNPEGFTRFVSDNIEQGSRELVLTLETYRKLGELKAPVPPGIAESTKPSLADNIKRLPRGLTYALGVLHQDEGFPVDSSGSNRALAALTGGIETAVPTGAYTTVIGRIGERPELLRTGDRPYRAKATVGRLQFDVRMESWLPTDTIRRSGFGHVIINRSHALTLERGVSLLVVTEAGMPVLTEYRTGIFEPLPRFVLGSDRVASSPCYR